MNALDVIAGKAKWSADCADALAWLRALPSRSMSLVFKSPPYGRQRTYKIGFKLTGQAWVDWLRPIIVESARVSAGLVIVNAAGPCENHSYQPIMEWLVSDLTRLDGLVCGPSPYAWVKSGYGENDSGNGIFGSGGKKYQRRDWEPLYAFCLPDRLPLAWTDNTAFGTPPKPDSYGGEASNRNRNGDRVNSVWKGGLEHAADGSIKVRRSTANRAANGDRKIIVGAKGTVPLVCNPGNVIRSPVGGAKLGHPLAHENEAPMSQHVAERCICWFAEPESIVCDPFLGSGTTGAAALEFGRRFVGCDVRSSQVELTERRLGTTTLPLFAS